MIPGHRPRGMLPGLRRPVRRVLRRHRRLVSALLAGAAVLAALSELAPVPPETIAVVTAARDLAAGTTLTQGDVDVVELPRELSPAGVLRSTALAVGRSLAGAVRSGEPITDVRLSGSGLLSGLPAGHVAVPLRLADPGVLAIVAPGDRVDVHAVAVADTTGPTAAVADVVIDDLLVLGVPPSDDPLDDGSLLVVAASRETARTLARAAAAARFSIAVRAPR